LICKGNTCTPTDEAVVVNRRAIRHFNIPVSGIQVIDDARRRRLRLDGWGVAWGKAEQACNQRQDADGCQNLDFAHFSSFLTK
jgi:hypothetical protein